MTAVLVAERDLVSRYPDDLAVLPTGDGIAEPFVHEQGFLNGSGNRGFDSGRLGDQLGERIGIRVVMPHCSAQLDGGCLARTACQSWAV